MARITENMIKDMMKKMDCSQEEAIDILKWDMEDEECDNEEAQALQEKAVQTEKEEKSKTKKGATKQKGSSLDKVKHQKAKKKADATKEEIMGLIKKLLDESECFTSPQEMTASKFTFKDKDGNYCSISMTKHKAKPDGYKED